MMRHMWYKLGADGRTPEVAEPGEYSYKAGWHVAKTKVGDAEVSTVFLGLDHGWEVDAPPILFETMVFGGVLDQEQVRYATWAEAESGHAAMVARVKERT
jgi:hypothetical protein